MAALCLERKILDAKATSALSTGSDRKASLFCVKWRRLLRQNLLTGSMQCFTVTSHAVQITSLQLHNINMAVI